MTLITALMTLSLRVQMQQDLRKEAWKLLREVNMFCSNHHFRVVDITKRN